LGWSFMFLSQRELFLQRRLRFYIKLLERNAKVLIDIFHYYNLKSSNIQTMRSKNKFYRRRYLNSVSETLLVLRNVTLGFVTLCFVALCFFILFILEGSNIWIVNTSCSPVVK